MPPSTHAPSRRRFVNVPLRTQDGNRVRFYDDLVRDRAVVISFMYTRCSGSCPLTSGKLATLQDRFGERMGRDLTFLSITLDPEHDGPAELRRYAASYDAKPGWLFLTGRRGDIARLRWDLGVRDLDPKVDQDRTQHGTLLTFGNDRTGRWAALPALGSVPFLAAAIQRITGPQPSRP
jgi:protein SCO1